VWRYLPVARLLVDYHTAPTGASQPVIAPDNPSSVAPLRQANYPRSTRVGTAVFERRFPTPKLYGGGADLLVAYAPFVAGHGIFTGRPRLFQPQRTTDMAAKTRKKTAAGKTKAKPKARAKTNAKATPRVKVKAGAGARSKPSPKSKTPAKPKASARTKAKVTVKSKATAKPKSTPKRQTASVPRAVDSPFKNFTPYEPKRGEAYMGSKQLDHFRDILLKWRQELMEEVDRTVHHMQDEAANFPDPADRATQEEEFSIELRTRDRERKLIKKIDQTIERIDQEDYGYCDTCGVEIGLRRLEARPTATQCVDCKTLDEIKERQLHG
jgi:RNA polymerase-binding transcription factor